MSDTNTDYIAVQRCFFFVFLAVILCSNLLSVFFIFFSFSLILFSFENWRYKKQGKNCRSFENWLCGGWLAHDCTCCLSVCVLHVLSVCCLRDPCPDGGNFACISHAMKLFFGTCWPTCNELYVQFLFQHNSHSRYKQCHQMYNTLVYLNCVYGDQPAQVCLPL